VTARVEGSEEVGHALAKRLIVDEQANQKRQATFARHLTAVADESIVKVERYPHRRRGSRCIT
jgi:hypothetical protein